MYNLLNKPQGFLRNCHLHHFPKTSYNLGAESVCMRDVDWRNKEAVEGTLKYNNAAVQGIQESYGLGLGGPCCGRTVVCPHVCPAHLLAFVLWSLSAGKS